MYHDLSEKEMMRVAIKGRAVSPVTSYLAIEPGVRPSTAGIVRNDGSWGIGLGEEGYGGGGFISSRNSERVPPQPGLLLEGGVQRCVAKHHPPADWALQLSLESTHREVVDVSLHGPPDPFGICVMEEAWRLELTIAYNLRRESFLVRLP